MQRLVGSFDNFTNFVVARISGHKWIWVKRQAKQTKERRASFLKGAFALIMATVKTIPQYINLIGRLTKNNKSAARAARTLEHFSNACAKFRASRHFVALSQLTSY